MADRAKTWTGPEADAVAACVAINKLAGYPRIGVGGSLVQAATWDGTGKCPAGWTMAVAPAVDAGVATLNAKGLDVERLSVPAERAKLTPAEQVAADKIAWLAKILAAK